MGKYLNLLFMCHRLPERSFFFRGKQFPLCARCTGIFLGYIIGIIIAFTYGKLDMLVALLFITPLLIDGTIQYLSKYRSTNVRRLITGIVAGVGTDFIFYGIIHLGFNHGRSIAKYILMYGMK